MCDVCEKICNSQYEFKEHMKAKHSQQNMVRCSICDTNCRTNEDLNVHMRKHKKPETFHCDFCGSKSNYVGLQKHLNFKHQIFSKRN